MTKILVIEDDDGVRSNIVELLELEGFDPIGAADGETGVSLAVERQPDLVICDVAMPGIDGYEVFEILSAKPATAVIPFIFLSARAERADVRRGMTLGADDYLTKPFTRVELLDAIRGRLRRRRVTESLSSDEKASLRQRKASLPEEVVAKDPAIVELFEQAERLAKGELSVLILGETGVGKEILAEHVHQKSGRTGPFVPVNCAALTESLIESELFGHEKGAFTGALESKPGLFESAHRGTLFFDEVGDLPVATQIRLLRVLEERRVTRVGGRSSRSIDVRFVAATNRDLEQEVADGRFRQDLFFRLNGITLVVPALRDRRGDIRPLAEHFLVRACAATHRPTVPRLSAEAQSLLEAYSWPGNIREFRNVVERAVLLCEGDVLEPRHLPAKLIEREGSPGPGAGSTDPRERLLQQMENLDRQRLVDALERCGGNQTQAAKLLGVSRRTLVSRLDQYNLPRPRKKEG